MTTFWACRLSTQEKVEINEPEEFFRKTFEYDDVEQVDPSTLKVWEVVDYLYANDSNRLFAKDETVQPEPPFERVTVVGYSQPCYIQIAQEENGTVFTLLSEEKAPLHSIRWDLRKNYDPIKSESLDAFIQHNHVLERPITTGVSFMDTNTGYEENIRFHNFVTLNQVLAGRKTAIFAFTVQRLNIQHPVKVDSLTLFPRSGEIKLSTSTEVNEDEIGKLFTTVDGIFKGTPAG